MNCHFCRLSDWCKWRETKWCLLKMGHLCQIHLSEAVDVLRSASSRKQPVQIPGSVGGVTSVVRSRTKSFAAISISLQIYHSWSAKNRHSCSQKQVGAVRYIRSLRRVYFRKSQMQPNSVMRPYSDTLVIIVDL